MDFPHVSGQVAPNFSPVLATFEENFKRDAPYKEIGASFCVYWKGECVVDVWGGLRDKEKGELWSHDTTTNIYSSTKALTALCIAVLVDRGLIAYEDAVIKHWPEFGQNGKQDTTIAHLLSHQSGNSRFEVHTVLDDLLDWQLIVDRLEKQSPSWAPGSATAYHPVTYGYLAGELLRRVTGTTIGNFFNDEIASRLNAEAYIGLPKLKHASAARLYGPELPPPLSLESPPVWAIEAMTNPTLDPECHNHSQWRSAELPAFGGFASAHGLATVYASVAEDGVFNEERIVSSTAIDQLSQVWSDRVDSLMGLPVEWGAGVAINNIGVYGPNPKTFGHSGWGGSVVIADRKNRVSMGYVCNQMSPDSVGDVRASSLIDTFYGCL